MSVRRAQLEIDSGEFSEWMAYAALEPFGPIREDERAGVVASVTANVNRDSKTKRDPFVSTDFFPRHPIDEDENEEALKDAEPVEVDLAAKLKAWAAVMADNGRRAPKSEQRRRS
jgi:Protein of unknown function (DUF4035)